MRQAIASLLLLTTVSSKHLRQANSEKSSTASPPSPTDQISTPLAIHEDIFHFVKNAESAAKLELTSIASARRENEERVDDWAKKATDAIKTTIEGQMGSHVNLQNHMSEFLSELLDESNELKKELDEKLKQHLAPEQMPLHHHKKVAPIDNRTPYQKIMDASDDELTAAVATAQSLGTKNSIAGGLKNIDPKYNAKRREKYHELGDLVYKLEHSMSELTPGVAASKALLSVTKGDVTFEHHELKDTVAHVEHMLKRGKIALDATKKMNVLMKL